MSRIHRTLKTYCGVFVLGVLVSVKISGCSLVGLGVGSMIDARRPAMEQLRADRIAHIHPGDSPVLVLDDSATVAGRYIGPARMGDARYQVRYERWRASNPDAAVLPSIGEPVRMSKAGTAGLREATLVAFTKDGVETSNAGGRPRPVRSHQESRSNGT